MDLAEYISVCFQVSVVIRLNYFLLQGKNFFPKTNFVMPFKWLSNKLVFQYLGEWGDIDRPRIIFYYNNFNRYQHLGPLAWKCVCIWELIWPFFTGGGVNGQGSGIVTTKRSFNREAQKYYYMPIIMKDSGNPMISGTNTLTITIGDRNDNKHSPGHKNIFVYNYKG